MADETGKIIDMASAKPRAEDAWFTRLQRSADGAILPNVANALMIFSNDPVLSGLLSYDAFLSQRLLNRAPPPSDPSDPLLPGPYPKAWELQDVALTQAYLQRLWSPRFAMATVEDAMCATAAIQSFHPVVDWLDSLVWDGKPRIDLWLVNAFDCQNTHYHRAVGSKF